MIDLFKPTKHLLFECNTILSETYKFSEIIESSIEGNIEDIKVFVQFILNETDTNLDIFYYPINSNESVLVLNKSIDTKILESLCKFCDSKQIILSLDFESTNKNYEKLGFVENTNLEIQEFIIRTPNINLTEGLMLFSGDSDTDVVKTIDTNSTNIQSYLYKKDWYDKYLKLINSKDYKMRRFKESHGVLINRNAKRNRGVSSRVGYAIVGKSKVI